MLLLVRMHCIIYLFKKINNNNDDALFTYLDWEVKETRAHYAKIILYRY